MKHLQNKQEEQKEEVNIQSLTGSPSPTAVSEVAMGGKGKTLYEHDEIEQADWIDRLKNGEHKSDIAAIEEAYANIFEGLAVLARHGKEC